jgi:hypothetical protein
MQSLGPQKRGARLPGKVTAAQMQERYIKIFGPTKVNDEAKEESG